MSRTDSLLGHWDPMPPLPDPDPKPSQTPWPGHGGQQSLQSYLKPDKHHLALGFRGCLGKPLAVPWNKNGDGPQKIGTSTFFKLPWLLQVVSEMQTRQGLWSRLPREGGPALRACFMDC